MDAENTPLEPEENAPEQAENEANMSDSATEEQTQGSVSLEKLMVAYKAEITLQGQLPDTFPDFCASAGFDVYSVEPQYRSFAAIEKAIWEDYLVTTLEEITSQEVYAEYSVREKLLSFYYTLFEVLKPDRKFAVWRMEQWYLWNLNPVELSSFQEQFEQYVTALVAEGLASGEIEGRWVLGERYAGWHKHQLRYLLTYWADDQSEALQNSDEAVEKAVNLGFDLMGKNVLDTALDFVKFWWQK